MSVDRRVAERRHVPDERFVRTAAYRQRSLAVAREVVASDPLTAHLSAREVDVLARRLVRRMAEAGLAV